jgi:RNA polymerase sigma-70 factor (ECF subfamily)
VHYQLFSCDYVQRLTAGDPETERHFVGYFSELLLIKLRRVVRTQQAVEDVRQETFLRVFHVLRHKGLANPERLGAFVNGVCNNVVAEHFRSMSKHSPFPDEGLDPPGGGPDPEEEMVSEERKRRVRQILERLPAKDREILRMVFLEERQKDDVCRICRVDRNYLRVLLHRAKNRFRDHLPERPAAARSAAFV